MTKFIITIDGPAGSGKSTVAKLLAEKLDAKFLDTGAMYRAVTLAAMQQGVELGDEQKLMQILDDSDIKIEDKDGKAFVLLDSIDVSERIREPDVTANAKYIASATKIRQRLVGMQRRFARRYHRVVTEGRDQGTEVFPNADVKFYLDADITERAKRRELDLKAAGQQQSLEQIKKDIKARDESDTNRTIGPLRAADDAVVVDTTGLAIGRVVSKLLEEVAKKTNKEPRLLWFKTARSIAEVCCRILFRIHIHGRENIPEKGPFLLVCNHQSFLDPVLCGVFMRRVMYFMAKKSLFESRTFGKFLTSINTIPIKRGEADISAVKTIISKLRQGSGICLFPEGTRSRDGEIAELKAGFGLLCRRTDAVIVPVVIEGVFECWPRHKKIFSLGTKITISYGQAITEDKIKTLNDKQLAEFLTSVLRQMLNDCRLKNGKQPLSY